MNNKRIFLAFVTASLVSGCASTPEGWTPNPYSETEYAPFKTVGSGAVKGQLFAKTKGGEVKKGAGDIVYLMPATSYGEQRYQEEFKNGRSSISNPDSRHAAAVLKKTADGEGRFEFTSVAEGRYIAFSTLTWEIPYYNSFLGWTTRTEGGLAAIKIDVKNGVTTDAILTP